MRQFGKRGLCVKYKAEISEGLKSMVPGSYLLTIILVVSVAAFFRKLLRRLWADRRQ